MNDDFLLKYRKAPRKAFGRALYRQLETSTDSNQVETHKRNRVVMLAAALALVFAVVLLTAREPQTAYLTQIDTRSPLEDLVPITAENAGTLEEVARLRNGIYSEVVWAGDVIAVNGTRGAWLYDDDLSAPPRLLSSSSSDFVKTGFALSPDGALLAVGDGSNIRLWDTATGTQRAMLTRAHESTVRALAFSPDGRWLASGSGDWEDDSDNAVFIWDWSTGEVVLRDLSHQRPITNVVFSPDGALLVSMDNVEAHVFNLNRAVIEHVLSGTSFNTGAGLAFTPDGQTLVIGADNRISLWDVQTGQERDSILYNENGSPGFITSIAFRPNGELVIGSLNRGVELWNIEENRFVRLPYVDRTIQTVNNVSVSPDGSRIALLPTNSIIEVWDVQRLRLVERREDADDRVLDMALSADGQTVAVGGVGENIDRYNLATGEQVESRQSGLLYTQALAADGALLAYVQQNVVHSADGIALLNTDSGEIERVLRVDEPEVIVDIAIVLTEEDEPRTLVAASDTSSHKVLLWDLGEESDEGTVIYQSSSQIHGLIALSLDGATLAVAQGDRLVLVDVATGEDRTVQIPLSGIEAITFSPDSARVSVGTASGVLRMIDVATGEVARTIEHGNFTISDIAYSPDGSMIVTVADFDIYLWNAESGELIQRVPAQNTNRLIFAPDGRYLVTGDWDGFVRVWGVAGE